MESVLNAISNVLVLEKPFKVQLEMEQSFSAKPPQRTVRAPLNAYGSPKLNILLYFNDLLINYNLISAII